MADRSAKEGIIMAKEELKDKDIKVIEALLSTPLLDRPEAIRIMAMKKRFVEQLIKIVPDDYPRVKGVAGVAEQYRVVMILSNTNLRWMHRIDWVATKTESLMREDKNMPWDVARKIAEQIIDSYPQIFVD
jgi:hypothetical protein